MIAPTMYLVSERATHYATHREALQPITCLRFDACTLVVVSPAGHDHGFGSPQAGARAIIAV